MFLSNRSGTINMGYFYLDKKFICFLQKYNFYENRIF